MRLATHDQCELPAEIPGVLNASVHPLCTDGTVYVRRISGEERYSGAIMRRLPMMQVEIRKLGRILECEDAFRRDVHDRL